MWLQSIAYQVCRNLLNNYPSWVETAAVSHLSSTKACLSSLSWCFMSPAAPVGRDVVWMTGEKLRPEWLCRLLRSDGLHCHLFPHQLWLRFVRWWLGRWRGPKIPPTWSSQVKLWSHFVLNALLRIGGLKQRLFLMCNPKTIKPLSLALRKPSLSLEPDWPQQLLEMLLWLHLSWSSMHLWTPGGIWILLPRKWSTIPGMSPHWWGAEGS